MNQLSLDKRKEQIRNHLNEICPFMLLVRMLLGHAYLYCSSIDQLFQPTLTQVCKQSEHREQVAQQAMACVFPPIMITSRPERESR